MIKKLVHLDTVLEKTSVEAAKFLRFAPVGTDAIIPYDCITHVRNCLKIEKAVKQVKYMFVRTAGNYVRMEPATESHFFCIKQFNADIRVFN